MPLLEHPVPETSVIPGRGAPPVRPTGAALPPALRADLLDPARWHEGLDQYARTTNLAVALADAEGRLRGPVLHPHPLWSLLHAHKPAGVGGCPFCLVPVQPCTCIADALATGRMSRTRGRTGLLHFAVPLVLGEHRLGVLLAGQVFDHYPEQLPVERVARQFGLPPQKVWQLARLEHPVKPATLEVYAGLLATLGQTFLLTQYHLLTEADRLAEMTRLRDQAVAEIAEREWAEAALHQSKLTFRTLLENLPAAAYTCNPDGLITYFNRHAVLLWGREPRLNDATDRFCGSFKLFAADGSPIPHDRCWMALALREDQEYNGHEIVIEHPDGNRLTVLANANPIRDASGNLLGAVNVLVDITERKQAEETKARLAAIIESSEDAIISKTLDGVIRLWNAGAEQLFGYTASEAIGQPITLIIPPQRHDEGRSILERLRRGERIEPFETVRRSKHGRLVDVSLSVSPVRDGTGRVVGASQVARDITARNQAQEALRQSEARFRRLANTMPQIAWIINPDNSLEFINEQWCAYTGLTVEQTRQHKYYREAVHPDDVQQVKDRAAEAQAIGSPFEVEFRLKRAADGAYRWFLGRGVPVTDEQGRIVKWFGTSTDIHDQKQAQEALCEADRRKDQFLATLAHELRNPLAPLRNIAQILRLDSPDPSHLELARDVIDRQVQQLTRLVDDLLDMARVTTGKVRLRKEPMDLAAVVARAVESSREIIDARQHELTVALPPEPVWLEADPVRLTQVLANLLNNAAKYTDEGGHIWLTVEREGEAVMRVRDTGVGIAAEMLPHVFDLFTQADRSLAHAQGGLGIGLSMVRSLVELHGGSVQAFSEGLGRGSEFVVRLPLVHEPPRPEDAEVADNGRRALTPARHILVVDDNKDAADSLALLLKMQGHEVHVAHDGATALVTAQKSPPEIVLLDIGLPGMDGHEVARRLRRDLGLTDVLLVALTGYGQEEDRRQSHKAGFDQHLVKPVDPVALQELLARSASLRTQGAASL